MKKHLVGFSAVALLLAACGGNNGDGNNTTNDGSEASSAEPIELTLSGWGSSPAESEIFNATLEKFMEEHPHITVNFDVIADQYMDVTRTRLIGGNAADVFFLDAFEAPALMETGVLEPLDDYITDDFNIDDFEDPLLEAFQRDGATYGLPKDTSTLAMFYNVDMFEAAGLEGPPETWEQMEEYAQILTDSTDAFGLGVVADLARLRYIAESKGGQIATDNLASFASPEVVEALQPIIDLKDAGYAAVPADVGADWGGEMFGQGRAAMMMEGNWTISFLEDTFPNLNWDTAELPTIDGQEGSMAYTVAYVMNAESEKKDAAWELISWLTGPEGMAEWTGGGFALPTRNSVSEELGLFEDEIRAPFAEAAAYATVWADDTNLPIINNNFNNEFLSAFLGNKSLEDALQEAQDVANREVE
ncbi:ABC transporter substrate-binding protein [Paenalkalicoccus suaedae]|uniref:ABC transporter substrate-binding protein n=1 Tax=Paenalkalicoccus suaedae TaxID=2592382 RepID=A0A859FCY0_9BACI|nr:ABC transporter substrate-binding protein [Paenalkalicoccus suaedae]QKS70661.1 ABC transporter substrate-binding protein [Paenalkalicoccus suaedae]